jgi:hypothetical protein
MRRALGALSALVVIAFVLAACGPQPAATPDVQSPVDGVVIEVDAASLTDVRGFTLRTSSGVAFGFKLGALENATEFSPSHLKEHQATSEPIRVWFRVENGDRVAYRIEDAPG